MNTLKCIVCTRPMKSVYGDDAEKIFDSVNQPSEGLTFTAHGQYGCTVFDPMNGDFLEINICDECLEHRGDDGGFILRGRPRRIRAETNYTPWVREKVDE